jgi:hypothetical protein
MGLCRYHTGLLTVCVLAISTDGKKVLEKRLQEQGFTREGSDFVNELVRP